MSKFIEDLRAQSLDTLSRSGIASRWHEHYGGTLLLFRPEFYDQIPEGETLINPKNEYFTFARESCPKSSYWGLMPYGFVHPDVYEQYREKREGINLYLDCNIIN